MSTSDKTADGLTWEDVDGLEWEEVDGLVWTHRGMIGGDIWVYPRIAGRMRVLSRPAGRIWIPQV